MSVIDDKYNALKKQGLDLGTPTSGEVDAPGGGRMRPYQHGNIYWKKGAQHAYEVHGGILTLYLANGGPGVHPQSGHIELGYPTSDQLGNPPLPSVTDLMGVPRPSDEAYPPRNTFEHGLISWTPGTHGVVLFGPLYQHFQQNPFGAPISSTTALPNGGTVLYTDRGVYFMAPSPPVAAANRFLFLEITPPLMGRPTIMSPDDPPAQRTLFNVGWAKVSAAAYQAITAWRPTIINDLLQGRFALSPTGSPMSMIPLAVGNPTVAAAGSAWVDIQVPIGIPKGGPLDLKDRTLYDLQLNLPNGIPYMLSPHCMYAKKAWDDFGLFHVTDLHVNGRNDNFGNLFVKLSPPLPDAAQHYANFQNSLRDFIHYANKLHKSGLADAVVATGDLIDFVFEDGDEGDVNNFARLRKLLLGQWPYPNGQAAEELQIPFFSTFGNHDYRIHPYDLECVVNPANVELMRLKNYSSHNLIESEAIALQHGVPEYGVTNAGSALRMLQRDKTGASYAYYDKYFAGPNQRSYVVKLGKHRLVMLDTGYDEGVPDGIGLSDLAEALVHYAHLSTLTGIDLPHGTVDLLNGGTPTVGFLDDTPLTLLRGAIQEAGADGLVIVGMHVPAFEPRGHEYPYFFRETLHPTADPNLTTLWLERGGQVFDIGDATTWPKTGTPYFKTGDTGHGLDQDSFRAKVDDFIKMCTGVGQPRPVDMILYGHVHDRVEFRVTWDAADTRLRYYHDFYTENPTTYYNSNNDTHTPGLAADSPIVVAIEEGASVPPTVTVVTQHAPAGSKATPRNIGRIVTPPYATPLNKATDPKAWWASHRPIFAQTAALGPGDPRQRFGTYWTSPFTGLLEVENGKPGPPTTTPMPVVIPHPPAQGFRLLQVHNGVIWRSRYVVLSQLRADNFVEKWESETPGIIPPVGPVHTGGGGIHPVDGDSGGTPAGNHPAHPASIPAAHPSPHPVVHVPGHPAHQPE
jgi:hypothetical protein